MYRMSDDFHGQIPQILVNRAMMASTIPNVGSGMSETQTIGTPTTINNSEDNSIIIKNYLSKKIFGDEDVSMNFDFFDRNTQSTIIESTTMVVDSINDKWYQSKKSR